MTGVVACPGCGDLLDAGYKWCPTCGKWLRLIGPTASELHYRRKDLLTPIPPLVGEALPPREGMED